MPGIIPEGTSGGVEARSAGGVCLNPGNVTNAYCPDASFTSDCAFSFLPDDCTARLTAAQTNAFQSEMLCLAEAFDPNGNWDCESLCNLSSNFANWRTTADDKAEDPTSFLNVMQDHLCARAEVTDLTSLADPKGLACDGDGNIVQVALATNTVVEQGDGIEVEATTDATTGTTTYTVTVEPQATVGLICADDDARNALIACLISNDVDNALVANDADGKLYVPEPTVPPASNTLISTDGSITIVEVVNADGSIQYDLSVT